MVIVLISELSQTTGVPVATIKFYLREGLLPPGEARSRTRAEYAEAHVARLRLVRALVDVGGMPLQRVRDVLAALDDEGTEVDQALAAVHPLLAPDVPDPVAPQRDRVAALLTELGWSDMADSPHGRALAHALAEADAAGLSIGPDRLRVYAEAAHEIAAAEVGGMPRANRPGAVTYAVLGTLLAEPVILALRRLAQQQVATSG